MTRTESQGHDEYRQDVPMPTTLTDNIIPFDHSQVSKAIKEVSKMERSVTGKKEIGLVEHLWKNYRGPNGSESGFHVSLSLSRPVYVVQGHQALRIKILRWSQILEQGGPTAFERAPCQPWSHHAGQPAM